MLWAFTILLLPTVSLALNCMECVDVPDPQECTTVTRCTSTQKCVVTQYISSGGLILYSSGCLANSLCTDRKRHVYDDISTSTSKRQQSSTDIVTCEECCDGDFCNVQGCGTKAVQLPNRGPICFSCPQQADPDSCRDVKYCGGGQECALYQHKTGGDQLWGSQCVNEAQCGVLITYLGRRRQEHDYCARCCKDDFCNRSCRRTVTAAAATTPIPSPTTPIPIHPTHKATQATQKTTQATHKMTQATHKMTQATHKMTQATKVTQSTTQATRPPHHNTGTHVSHHTHPTHTHHTKVTHGHHHSTKGDGAQATTASHHVASTAAPHHAASTAAPHHAASTAAPHHAASTAASHNAPSTAASHHAPSTAAPHHAASTAAPHHAASTAAPHHAASTAAPHASKVPTTQITPMMTTSDPEKACVLDGYVYDAPTRLCLKVYSNHKNWTNAMAVCVKEKGTLAIANTDLKAKEIALLLENYPKDTLYWVGANDANSVHAYTWSTGEVLIYDNSTSIDLSNNNCILVSASSSSPFSVDVCHQSHAFVCERKKSIKLEP